MKTSPCLVDALEPRRLCAAGDPVGSFGAFGTAGFAKPFREVYPSAILPLADGKTLVAVARQRTNGPAITPVDFIRLNADGSRDNTFGEDSGVDTFFSLVVTAAASPDGKFVAFGYTPSVTRPGRFDAMIARFNADGTLDQTFGKKGRAQLSPTRLGDRSPLFPHLTAAGVLTVGTFRYGQQSTVVRFNPDGTGDKTFGVGGVSNFAADRPLYSFSGIEVAQDGSVFIEGRGVGNDVLGPNLRKLRPDGTDDLTFKPTLSASEQAYGVNIIGDSVLVNYYRDTDGDSHTAPEYRLAKVDLVTGARRAGFGTDGVLVNPPLSATVVEQPDGKLLFFRRGSYNQRVDRINADGTPDDTFGKIEVETNVAAYDAATGSLLVAGPSGVLAVALTGAAPGPVTVDPDGTLAIAGTPGQDTLAVETAYDHSGGPYDSVFAQRGAWGRVVRNAGLTGVLLDGGRGDDALQLFTRGNDVPLPATLIGASGADSIEAGHFTSSALSSATVVISGGTGNDTILVAVARATVDAGAGDDSISASAYDNTDPARIGVLHGGAGNDKIFTRASRDTIAFQLFGDEGNDTLKSGLSSDTINGGAGADSLRSGGGVDTFFRDNDDIA